MLPCSQGQSNLPTLPFCPLGPGPGPGPDCPFAMRALCSTKKGEALTLLNLSVISQPPGLHRPNSTNICTSLAFCQELTDGYVGSRTFSLSHALFESLCSLQPLCRGTIGGLNGARVDNRLRIKVCDVAKLGSDPRIISMMVLCYYDYQTTFKHGPLIAV